MSLAKSASEREIVGSVIRRVGINRRRGHVTVGLRARDRRSADRATGAATATSLPSWMKGSAVAMVEQVKSTRPDMISVSISGIPRNGTCKASKPAAKRSISAEMWVAEPTPAVPNVARREHAATLVCATRRADHTRGRLQEFRLHVLGPGCSRRPRHRARSSTSLPRRRRRR
jgi:hypothetical protein